MFLYSPKSASFIKPCKMGFHKWRILVDSKISHLWGFTVLRPNKITVSLVKMVTSSCHLVSPYWFPMLALFSSFTSHFFFPLFLLCFVLKKRTYHSALICTIPARELSAGKINVLSIYIHTVVCVRESTKPISCTAVWFQLFIFTKWCDWSIWKIDDDDWLRAVAGIQNSK